MGPKHHFQLTSSGHTAGLPEWFSQSKCSWLSESVHSLSTLAWPAAWLPSVPFFDNFDKLGLGFRLSCSLSAKQVASALAHAAGNAKTEEANEKGLGNQSPRLTGKRTGWCLEEACLCRQGVPDASTADVQH